MIEALRQATAAEGRDGTLNVTDQAGFFKADVPFVGPSVAVTGLDSAAAADIAEASLTMLGKRVPSRRSPTCRQP